MFNAITWPQYLGAVAGLLVLYYAYVGLVYYRAELTGFLSGKRGKAAAGELASSAAPASLLNRGPLIPKAAAIVAPAAVVATVPAATSEQEEAEQEEVTPDMSVAADEQQEDTVPEVTADASGPDEEQAIEGEQEQSSTVEFSNHENNIVRNSVNFTEAESDQIDPAAQDEGEETAEEFDEDFTVGVSQLSNYFDRAADGELTREQLVKEVPELENTDVLMAFYKTSTKSAQQLTATTYANVAEPALN